MIGNKVCFFQSLDSTNSFMKQNLKSFKHGDIICARVQTAGKGRRSNIWMSNDGDLHISILLDNTEKKDSIFDVILVITNTLLDTLNHYGIEASIKYPNDIVVGTKKISGILVERVLSEKDLFIIGVGLNVVTEDFSRIEKKGTSILLETGKTYDYRDVLQEFILSFNKVSELKSCDLYNNYIQKNVAIGRTVLHKEEEYTVKGINLEGKIVIVKDNIEYLKHMNEVSFKEFYNE